MSNFRKWFKYLNSLHGRQVQWPQLLRLLFEEEVTRIREFGIPYTGQKVFIDRDDLALQHMSHPGQSREDILVYGLYRKSYQENPGYIKVGGEDIWLVSCQVPNQGNHARRCADLLGIKKNGSLVVFECKVVTNENETPLVALLEGLDYLAHLLIKENLERLSDGFNEWKSKTPKSLSRIPTGFENVAIEPSSFHSVIVLAPVGYYEFMRMDAMNVDQDWEYLSDRFWPNSPCTVGFDFAVTDFSSNSCELLPLTTK